MDSPIADVSPSGDRIFLWASPRLRELVKSIPGALYKAQGQHWSLPLSTGTARAMRSLMPDLQISQDLDAWGRDAFLDQANRVYFKTAEPQATGPWADLYPFQRIGASFLLHAGRALLADEMGTGKTIQALEAISQVPALVIAPNSMLWTWKAEAEKWLGCTVSVIAGSAAKREKAIATEAAIYVVGWANVRNHSRLAPYGSIALSEKEKQDGSLNLKGFQTVIVDEAHRMVDPRAKQTRAVWALMHKAQYRYALTGTPITNSPEDIWSIMHGIAPEEYPSRSGFINRYTINGVNYFGGLEVYGLNPATRSEFLEFFDSRYLRRTKAEVLPDLPPKVHSFRYVDLAPTQRKAYDHMANHLLAEFDGELLFADNPLTKLTRLKQIAAATPVLDELGQVVALTMPSAKIDALFELIEDDPGEQMVIFTESRLLAKLVIEELTKKKHSVAEVTGDVTGEERTRNVERFQSGECQYIVCTLGAGGEGITLTAARTTVFLQRSDSMVLDRQAEDRTHRLGQEADSVHIIDIVARATSDYGILANVADKGEKLEEVTRDREALKRIIRGEA